jgi:hypothetical protein
MEDTRHVEDNRSTLIEGLTRYSGSYLKNAAKPFAGKRNLSESPAMIARNAAAFASVMFPLITRHSV